MTYTSLNFALFVGVTMLCYFLLPWKKYRWAVLLVASYFFYLVAGYRYAAFIVLTTVTTYLAALRMEAIARKGKAVLAENKTVWDKENKKAHKEQVRKQKKTLLALVLILNFGILVFLKYYNMFAGSLNSVLGAFSIQLSVPTLKLFLPLGISFYTFQSMGYLMDVYNEKVEAERNLGKLALFVSFFPQIIQGPISIYSQLAHQLYESHDFDFTRFKHACELILWGLLKKLVIADRAVIAITAGTEVYAENNGTTLLFLVLLYAIQLYADFSGGVDISRGVAQIFGIHMIDNFRQPYFADSISEYWHRWHISLGEWFRTYLFYPLAMSKSFTNASKKIKASKFGQTEFGKHVAKVLPTSFASFIVFFLVGVWHGPNWKYVAFGVWNGGIIMLSVLLKPLYATWLKALKINVKSFAFRLFQIARTFLIVLIGYVFDVAPNLAESMKTFWKILTDQNFRVSWIQLTEMGLAVKDYGLILFASCILLCVSLYHERTGNASLRKYLDTKPFLVRYFVILFAVLFVLYYGIWGPGYDPADFVYMQF